MRDSSLLVIACACAVCGLFTLFMLAERVQPVVTEIAQIEPGDYAACEGIVYRATRNGEHLFVTIFDGSSLAIPFFNCKDNISVGDLLYIEGRASDYYGATEIIPQTYRVSTVFYGRCSDSLFKTSQGDFHVELSDGIHAVTGTITGDTLTVERELLFGCITPFCGRISSYYQTEDEFRFTLAEKPQKFYMKDPVGIGEITGCGVQVGEEVVVLFYEWNELPLEPVADAKARPPGYPVRVQGIIRSVTQCEGHIFLVISDPTGCILVPIFNGMCDTLGVDADQLHAGQCITVTGRVAIYQGAPEILPHVIT